MKNNKPTFDLKQRINSALSLSAPAVKMQEGGKSITTEYIDSILNKNKNLNWVNRLYQKNTPSIIIPGQNEPSTHFMQSADNIVYPTIVQKKDGSLEYLGDKAYDYAIKTGEYIEFPSEKEANDFAINYKMGTNVLNQLNKEETFQGGALPEIIITAPRKKQGGTIQEGGTVNRLQQMMGYKDNSPYKNLPYQDIYSDRITMQGVSRPLIAKTDTGVTTVMQPGEEYYFPGASKVREVPMYKNGGELKDRENFQQMKLNTYIDPLTRQLGKSVRKFQNSGNTSQNQADEDDAWIREILEFEATKGSSTGGGLTNWGYNEPKGYRYDSNTNLYVKKGAKPDSNGKYNTQDLYQQTGKYTPPSTINEAVKRFKQEYLPDFKKYPIEVRKRLADYAYNSGRSVEDLLLFAAGKISLDDINGPNVFTDEWNKYKDEIQKSLNDPAFIQKLDNARRDVAKTTPSIKKDKNGNIIYDANGKPVRQKHTLQDPNPAFEATWSDRINLWGTPSQTTSTTPAAKDTANPSTKKENKVVEWDKNGTSKGDYVLTNEAPKGSTIKLKDPITGQIVEAKVLGPIPEGVYDKNTKVVLSPNLGKTLKLDTRGANGTAITRVNLETEYTPIPAPSQPAAANNNQQANTQQPAQNTQQNTQVTTNPPVTNTGPTVPAAPNQGSTQVAVPPTSSTGATGASSNAPTNPPAASTTPAADDSQYIDIIPIEGDTSYEYRFNKKTNKYETKRKESPNWIVLDDSTEKLRKAKREIENRYGEQVKKVQEETAKSSAAPAGTGTGTGAGTDNQGVGAGTAVNQNPPTGLIINPIEAKIRAWRGGASIQNPSTPTQQGIGTGTSTGTSTQGTASGTTPPSTNSPSGSTVIPPSSIRRSEIREFPGRIFDPIPEEQDRTIPGLKDRNPIMRERPYEILEPDMPWNQGSVGQGGASGATDKRDPVNIPTLPTSPLKPINPSQSSSANITTPTVKDNAVRIGNVDFSKANASENNPSDFQGWYGAGNKTFYQTKDGTIKIVTDNRGRFYLENEDKLYEVYPPDSLDISSSITGKTLDEDTNSYVDDPERYDKYWQEQLQSIKSENKKGIPSKEFYGKKRRDDYGNWNYKKGGFMQGGEVQQFGVGGDIAKGASTGATLGAALGTIVPGIGNVIGGAVGALVGGAAGGISGAVKSSKEKKEARRLHNNAIAAQNRASSNTSLLDLLKGNNSLSSLLMGPQNLGTPSYMPQIQGMQYNSGLQGMPMSPYMTNLMPPPFQEGAQVQQPQPAIYTEDFVPGAYKTGLDKVSLTGTPYVPTELKMTPLSTPVQSSTSSGEGVKTITIYDKDTNRPRRIYVDNTGKMLGYADNKETLYNQSFDTQKEKHDDLYRLSKQWRDSIQPAISTNKDAQDISYLVNNDTEVTLDGQKRKYGSLTPEEAARWKEGMMQSFQIQNQSVPQQQQGGPIITGLLYRNLGRNNSIKNNISVNKTKLQDVINLSNKVNPYRLYPGGVYKNGGMIMEGGVSASRAGFSRQPITGASSTGPLGPKRTETPDYTNKGVRSLMDLPSNEYVPTENLIPIQTEKGEMIVLPTGDLMPVMARKRHYQMQDDEVTDVTPENSYILSAHGQVRINRNEADLLITETGVKPYRLGQAQNPPTEKTLGSIMTKSIMKPAEVAKRINSLFPVLSSTNPFEIAANVENKINRKPYLEGLIQLSELDKYRKGLSEPAMSDLQQQQMQMQGQGSPMLARQGGRTVSMPGIVRAQGGGPINLPSLPTPGLNSKFLESMYPSQIQLPSVGYSPGYFDAREQNIAATRSRAGLDGQTDSTGLFTGVFAPANFAARLIGAQALRNAEKRGIARERDIYGRSFNKMGSLMGLGTGLEAAMLGAQDPFVKFTETPDTYIRTMRTQTPSQLLEAQASSAYANLPDYSQMGAAGLGAQNAAYAQGLAASARFLGEAAERDRALFNRQQELLQANMAQNVAGRLAAQRATDAAVNKMLSGYGNLANRYTQGLVDLTGQRMGADLGLSRAEQASQAGLYGNRLNAFTTFTGDLTAGGEDLLKFYGLG